ncbi:hypothetical protein CHELA40_12011 [Chelatococcus asaccharovorans]|nr:hypothetical protein CHELA40_12011 [Chelatococcus asaccharovorans]CAH1683623.1 hypothetical protein CHELA17_63592 [Chelatococcus asaccharovorans]
MLATLLGEADTLPVYMGHHFFALGRLPGIEAAFRELSESKSERIVFQDLLRRAGVADFRRRNVKIRARLPEASEAHHLQIGRSVPLLETIITLVDSDGIPLVHAFSAYCSDRIELVLEM